jgi:hypothetical protein
LKKRRRESKNERVIEGGRERERGGRERQSQTRKRYV